MARRRKKRTPSRPSKRRRAIPKGPEPRKVARAGSTPVRSTKKGGKHAIRRGKAAPSAFTAALISAAYHSLEAEQKRFGRRSRAQKRAWERRKYKAVNGPPKAFTVLDIAKEFGDPIAAVNFARKNLINPIEWADDVADEFDVDVHDLYEAYYDTDPAKQAA